MKNYFRTAQEVIDYCPRVDIPEGKELAFGANASALIDNYCERSLSIQYYIVDFELNAALVGYIPIRPLISLAPTTLTTGMQIRPMWKRWDGGREEIGSWRDVVDKTDDPQNSYYNLRTGRFEIFQSQINDYGRLLFAMERRNWRQAYSWQVQMEIYAGFLLDTTLSVPAIHGSTSLTLDSVIGVTANKTRINIGASTTQYLITSADTNTKVVQITPAITGTLSTGTEITEVVPEAVKWAAGAIISDQNTYEPNTDRQTSTLDVLTDRLSRMGSGPVPDEAKRLLAPYRNF